MTEATQEVAASDAAIIHGLNLASRPLHAIVDHLLEAMDDAINPDTGEVDPRFEAYLESLGFALERKVEVYAAVNDRLRAEADALADLGRRYGKRAGVREGQAKRLRERLKIELERLGRDKVKTPTATAAIQKNPASVDLTVLDESELPDEYVVVTRSADIAKIKAALQTGVVLPFAELRHGTHLRFR